LARTVWIVSEIYYPEEIGTGYYLAKLAEGLSQYFNLKVLCGYPTYDARGKVVPAREVHNGVEIERCRGTTFNKDIVALRVFNLISVSLSIFLKALRRLHRHDVVLVTTNPPLLPFVIWLACRLRGARCILRLDDVYPEIMIATGLIGPNNLAAKILRQMTKRLYRSVDEVVAMGRDMAWLANAKLGKTPRDIAVIANWGDTDQVTPAAKADNPLLQELGLTDKFIAQCAGNMGRTQGIENMFAAAEHLKNEPGIHFLFIGAGAKRKWMQETINAKHLPNITLIDQRPRSDQQNFLNACDIALVSHISHMTGLGVPSRMYNAMAAGKPVIAIVEPRAEAALVVNEEQIGWVMPPEQPVQLAETIRAAWQQPDLLAQLGRRARLAAEQRHSPSQAIEAYRALIAKFH